MSFKNVKVIGVIVVILAVIYSMIRVSYSMYLFDNRINTLEQRMEININTQKELLNKLNNLNDNIDEIKRLQEERKRKEQARKETIDRLKECGFSKDDDLIGSNIDLSINDMNRLIDTWTEGIAYDSVLKGHGEAFIIASKETGLNPIYLLAHAIIESGSGTSYFARTRNNFFGINAVDTNPNLAYNMGDGVDAGIINGAKWIKSNFYNNGYCTLQEMHNGNYATSPAWASEIEQVGNQLIRIL